MKRRDFLKTVSAATASAALPHAVRAAAGRPEKPNIVFILADDMGQVPVPSDHCHVVWWQLVCKMVYNVAL